MIFSWVIPRKVFKITEEQFKELVLEEFFDQTQQSGGHPCFILVIRLTLLILLPLISTLSVFYAPESRETNIFLICVLALILVIWRKLFVNRKVPKSIWQMRQGESRKVIFYPCHLLRAFKVLGIHLLLVLFSGLCAYAYLDIREFLFLLMFMFCFFCSMCINLLALDAGEFWYLERWSKTDK